jgi:hypothetical protein
MTGQVTFGDLLLAARRQIGHATGVASGTGDVHEVSHSMHRLVTVMARYSGDLCSPVEAVPRREWPLLHAWSRASLEAWQALTSAAELLKPHAVPRQPDVTSDSTLAARLETAAESLAVGRDLLQTHFASGPRGGRRPRSDWALAVTSPPVTRALLAELASMSQQIAPHGASLALSPSPEVRGTVEARRALAASCHWLSIFAAAIATADLREPVSAGHRELLLAIPLNELPPRRVPDGSEPVNGLCEGVTGSAQRARHATWIAASQATWSPGTSGTSLRRRAAASMLTGHHCEVLLRSLAARPAAPGTESHSVELLRAADAAGRARAGWLNVARALDEVTTDTPGYTSPSADETSNLAMWTGRLAYASPGWTLASGPTHPARDPGSLAPEAEDVPRVVDAVHHACETLTQLARADREHIQTAVRAGRILVPTRSLPDGYDVPRPYAEAPPNRIDSLLTAYRDAGEASATARDAVAGVAEATRAPSRMLTAARSAARVSLGDSRGTEPDRAYDAAVAEERRDQPGPVERILRDLGLTTRELLRRGAAIDRAGEELIIAAVGKPAPPEHGRRNAETRRKSAVTAALIGQALSSGDPYIIALLHSTTQRQREPPEREP